MRLLLDTNALLWQISSTSGGKLGPNAKRKMREASAVYVSAVTIAELHIKTMLGKLDAPADCQRIVTEAGDELLPWPPSAADALRDFPELARHDPFDRFLLAQAKIEGLVFLTSDQTLLGLGLHFVQDARK